MILSTESKVKLNYNNKEIFKNLGYDIDKEKEIFVKVEHLNKGSHSIIKIKCDGCGIEKEQQYVAYLKFISKNKEDKYYCKKCNSITRKTTNIERYGEDSPIKIKEFKENRQKTIINKYGTDHPCKNEEVKNKIINTNLERYGVKYIPQNKEIRKKIIETNILKFDGVSNFSSPKERIKNENIMLEKYGSKYSSQIKSINNIIVKRGVETRRKKIKNKYENIINIIGTNYLVKCDCEKNHEFIIDSHNFYQRLRYKTPICTICNPIDKHSSGRELNFINFIKEIYSGQTIENFRILDGQEIDIYISELKMGFEFNGLYWHSNKHKEIEYHKNKIDIANRNNIKLFHIYDDDWTYKKEIIINDIRRIIENNVNGIEILEMGENIAEKYNNENNLFGHQKSNINIAGILNDEIISMMSIKRNRNNFEITRLTGENNFDRLFEYFKNKYSPRIVIGSINKDWNIYNFYEKNNFSITKETEPEFHYIIENKRIKNDMEELFMSQIPKIYNSGKIFYKLIL